MQKFNRFFVSYFVIFTTNVSKLFPVVVTLIVVEAAGVFISDIFLYRNIGSDEKKFVPEQPSFKISLMTLVLLAVMIPINKIGLCINKIIFFLNKSRLS